MCTVTENIPTKNFGPWMLVQQKSRRSQTWKGNQMAKTQEKKEGNRFGVLAKNTQSMPNLDAVEEGREHETSVAGNSNMVVEKVSRGNDSIQVNAFNVQNETGLDQQGKSGSVAKGGGFKSKAQKADQGKKPAVGRGKNVETTYLSSVGVRLSCYDQS